MAEQQGPYETQVVIAHYNENLDWLADISQHCLIYTKGPNPPMYPSQTQKLPNIGREGHTYMHHIVANYDNLPEVTLFLQGRVDDHINLTTKEIFNRASMTQPGNVTTFPWRDLELFDHWDGIPWSEYPSWAKWTSMTTVSAPKTPGQYWCDLFGFDKTPDACAFAPGALFAVHRDTVYKHSKAYYAAILEAFFLGDMADINPETGHFMERFWLPMFCPSEYICWQYQTDTAREERNEFGQLAKGRWWVTPRGMTLDLRTVEPKRRAEMEMENNRGSATPPSMSSMASDDGSNPEDGGIGMESNEVSRDILMESE